MTDAAIAGAAGAAGVILAKAIDLIIAKKNIGQIENTDIVHTWQQEIKELRDRTDKLSIELDQWKVLYYKLMDEHSKQTAELEILKQKLAHLDETQGARRK